MFHMFWYNEGWSGLNFLKNMVQRTPFLDYNLVLHPNPIYLIIYSLLYFICYFHGQVLAATTQYHNLPPLFLLHSLLYFTLLDTIFQS